MSASVFPVLAGLGWSVTRREMWKTRRQEAVSGKETRIADWSYPRHQWTLNFDFLRQGALSGASYAEFAQLAGFFNLRQGMFDSFLYADADDNSVTGQGIATGDGATRTFAFVRGFGGFTENERRPLGIVWIDCRIVIRITGGIHCILLVTWAGEASVTTICLRMARTAL